MREVLDAMIRLSGCDIRVVEEQALTRKAEQQQLCGSHVALHLATGWEPEITLERTLADILAAETLALKSRP